MKYAVLTTRHHDGYCLWDSRVTDYSSARQAPGRDFVWEYVDAFRAEGLHMRKFAGNAAERSHHRSLCRQRRNRDRHECEYNQSH